MTTINAMGGEATPAFIGWLTDEFWRRLDKSIAEAQVPEDDGVPAYLVLAAPPPSRHVPSRKGLSRKHRRQRNHK